MESFEKELHKVSKMDGNQLVITAGKENLSPLAQKALLERKELRSLRHLASNLSITPEAQLQLISCAASFDPIDYRELLSYLATNKSISPQAQSVILKYHQQHGIFLRLCNNPSLTPENQMQIVEYAYGELDTSMRSIIFVAFSLLWSNPNLTLKTAAAIYYSDMFKEFKTPRERRLVRRLKSIEQHLLRTHNIQFISLGDSDLRKKILGNLVLTKISQNPKLATALVNVPKIKNLSKEELSCPKKKFWQMF